MTKLKNHYGMPFMIEDERHESMGLPFDRPTVIKRPAIMAHTYDFYFTRTIDEAYKYDEWIMVFEEAGEEDLITVHINSFGGSLETALQIHDALLATKATVHIQIEGACCSGASIIAMAGHRHFVAPNAYMMIHSWTGGTYGKFGNVIENTEFQKKWFRSVMLRCYKGFLSLREITSVLDGKDIWLDSEDVNKRYDKILIARREQARLNKAKMDACKEKVNKLLKAEGIEIADIIDA